MEKVKQIHVMCSLFYSSPTDLDLVSHQHTSLSVLWKLAFIQHFQLDLYVLKRNFSWVEIWTYIFIFMCWYFNQLSCWEILPTHAQIFLLYFLDRMLKWKFTNGDNYWCFAVTSSDVLLDETVCWLNSLPSNRKFIIRRHRQCPSLAWKVGIQTPQQE